MSDVPDECQYAGCEDSPDGALEFFFGVRWYCSNHYATMALEYEKDMTVIADPDNTQQATND